MKLTVKQEKFCIEYLKDGNASRAYREAYNCANMKDETIGNNAYKLLQRNDIATKVKELRAKIEDNSIMTAKQLKEFFTKVVMNTLEDDEPKLNERLKAAELLGKTMAIFVEKQEISGELNTNVVYLPPKKT